MLAWSASAATVSEISSIATSSPVASIEPTQTRIGRRPAISVFPQTRDRAVVDHLPFRRTKECKITWPRNTLRMSRVDNAIDKTRDIVAAESIFEEAEREMSISADAFADRVVPCSGCGS